MRAGRAGLRNRDPLDETTEQFRKAVKLNPDSDEFHYNPSLALQDQGNSGDAEVEHR